MSIAKPGFEAPWLARSGLLIVEMNRSHFDQLIGHLLAAKPDAERISARAVRLRDVSAAA